MIQESMKKLKQICVELETEIKQIPVDSSDNDSLSKRMQLNSVLEEYKNVTDKLVQALNIFGYEVNVANSIKIPLHDYEYGQNKEVLDRTEIHYIDEDFTGTKLASIEFKNIRYELKNWKEFYIKMCELFLDLNSSEFLKIAFQSDFKTFKRKPKFSKEKIKMQSEYKLGNNIYMETNYSANEITGMVTVFMNQLNYSKEDLKIYLSEKK